jgi:circadian clock protein KaiB
MNATEQLGGSPGERLDPRLYVTGQTGKSIRFLDKLTRFRNERLDGRYSIEVVDLAKRPRLAAADHILALPTLVLPAPIRGMIGDLANEERVLIGLDVRRRGGVETGEMPC